MVPPYAFRCPCHALVGAPRRLRDRNDGRMNRHSLADGLTPQAQDRPRLQILARNTLGLLRHIDELG
jgi:hypothetical protein